MLSSCLCLALSANLPVGQSMLPDIAIAQLQTPQTDIPFGPSPQAVVLEILKLAQVNQNDVVYDLGSGDGRIVITAAQQYGARGVGIEINPILVAESQENARKAEVSDRTQFLQQDLFTTDLSEATVVTLYLFPSLNQKLRPKLLRELRPGTRIVSHNYTIGNWKPNRVVVVKQGDRNHTLYLWIVPPKNP